MRSAAPTLPKNYRQQTTLYANREGRDDATIPPPNPAPGGALLIAALVGYVVSPTAGVVVGIILVGIVYLA